MRLSMTLKTPPSDLPVATTLFHVTHWKAGSQWILKILRTLAPERIVAPRTGEGQFLFDPLVPGAIYPTIYVTKEQFDAVLIPANSYRFVVLRDLRDTLISAYFSFRYSHGLIARGLADLHDQLEGLSLDDGLIFLAEKWLPVVASIHASWLAAGEPILRYEDLLQHDLEILEETLVRRGGLAVDSSTLRRVVEANRFDALTGGRSAGQEDTLSHQRKGIAGDWKNHFSQRVTKRFDELYGLPGSSTSGPRGASTPAPAATAPAQVAVARRLAPAEIMACYDRLAARNPNLPTYNLWLAWELAACSRFELGGRVLDLGCSDPGFFRLSCPKASEAIAVSTNPTFAEWGRQSGLYAQVRQVPDLAHLTEAQSVDHVFSRTLLSQTTRLPSLINEISRCLRPGGTLVCTVLTQRYNDWALLPRLFEIAGYPKAAAKVQREHLGFHRIAHALPIEKWQEHFADAGFTVEGCIPILPRITTNLFLLFDTLWHRPVAHGGEFGDQITAYLSARTNFRDALHGVVAAMMELETDWDDTAAVVFLLRKP
jgi:SAM-dependent methyltransferase